MSVSLANASTFQTEQNDLALTQELDFWMGMLDPVECPKEPPGAGGHISTAFEAESDGRVVDISTLKRKLSVPNIQASTPHKSGRPLGPSQSLCNVTSPGPAKRVAALKRTFSMSAAVPQPQKRTGISLATVVEQDE